MIKLLKRTTIFLVTIFVAYLLLVDGIIKSQLEREAFRALQAPLEIGKVTFHLIPTSLTLRNVQIGNARLPTYNLLQAEELSLPLSLRDLLAYKLIVDTVDVHGLRFNRPHDEKNASAPHSTASATNSLPLRETLQRVQQMVNHPLASNTIDPNASITGAMLADQFKPLLAQITAALTTLATASSNKGDWQILVHHINVDGALDFGVNSTDNSGALRFTGVIDNATPQPELFDVITQVDFRSVEGEPATLHVNGALDKRKLTQAALRFDLNNFPLTQWPLSNDPELKISIISAKVSAQAMLSLAGNQFDLNTLAHFRQAHFDIANSNNDIARVVADVWRRTDAFDINLQASGDLSNPVLKLNSSLDVPLASAIQKLQPASAFPQAAPLPTSP